MRSPAAAISAVLLVGACSSQHEGAVRHEPSSTDADGGSVAGPSPSPPDAGTGPSPSPTGTTLPHSAGAQCGGKFGTCDTGLSCLSLAALQCAKGAFFGAPCNEGPAGYCYPEGAAPCSGDGSLCGGFSSPLGTSTAAQTCCAPLGDAGAFTCVEPGESAACESCSVKSGDDYPEADCEPGHCPEVIAMDQEQVLALAADGSNVYWSTYESILSAPAQGGAEPTVLQTVDYFMHSLVAGGESLFMSNGYEIFRMPKAGGAPEEWVTIESAGSMTTASDALYWVGLPGQLQRRAFDDSPVETIAQQAGRVDWFTLGADSIYFVLHDPKENAGIWSVPLAGGTAVLRAPGADGSLTVDDENLYWVSSAPGPCGSMAALMKQPFDGSPATRLAAIRGSFGNIVADGERVYWISEYSLLSVPRNGGPVTALASKKARSHLLLEGDRLYWVREVDTGGHTVMTLKLR